MPFSKRGSDLSRSEKRVSFLPDLGNKGTIFMTFFMIWSHFHLFPTNYSPRNSHPKSFQLPFRDKGTILKHIIVPYHAQILNLVVHLCGKGLFLREKLRKGCDSSIINFRDMGAFQNLPDAHVNIGFYLSDPPGDP